MPSTHPDPAALGFTIVALSIALEETLKALAEKNGNQPGQWLDEVQDLALLRAQAHLSERASAQEADAAKAALAVTDHIFVRMRSGFSDV
jgi:membrane-bound lytic murein transglycosylase MltF